MFTTTDVPGEFARISKLSDVDLVKNLHSLRETEHQATVQILLHLKEVERRGLHLTCGYPSLFEYCRSLGYSEGGAMRRITAARCIRDFPEVYELLRDNKVNLSTISVFAPVLTEANSETLLGQVAKQSRRKVEEIVSPYLPRQSVKDKDTVLGGGNALPSTAAGGGNYENGEESDVRYKLEFEVGKEFIEQLEQFKELCSRKFPEGMKLEGVFQMLMAEYLERHSPAKKVERREKRASRKAVLRDSEDSFDNPMLLTCSHDPNSRYVPKALREQVYVRDEGQCTYISENSIRCCARQYLEIDHIVPFAHGGTTELSNLRLLCTGHNLLEAEMKLGKEFMEQFYDQDDESDKESREFTALTRPKLKLTRRLLEVIEQPARG